MNERSSPMECHDVRIRLPRYLDGDLPPDRRTDIEAHLDHCYECVEEMHEIVALLDVCRDAMRHPAPRDRFEALRPMLAADLPRMRWPIETRPRSVLAKLAAAAAILIIIVSVADTTWRTARGLQRFLDASLAPATDATVTLDEPISGPPLLVSQERMKLAEALADGAEIVSSPPATPPAPTEDDAKATLDVPAPVSWRPNEEQSREVGSALPNVRLVHSRPLGPLRPFRGAAVIAGA